MHYAIMTVQPYFKRALNDLSARTLALLTGILSKKVVLYLLYSNSALADVRNTLSGSALFVPETSVDHSLYRNIHFIIPVSIFHAAVIQIGFKTGRDKLSDKRYPAPDVKKPFHGRKVTSSTARQQWHIRRLLYRVDTPSLFVRQDEIPPRTPRYRSGVFLQVRHLDCRNRRQSIQLARSAVDPPTSSVVQNPASRCVLWTDHVETGYLARFCSCLGFLVIHAASVTLLYCINVQYNYSLLRSQGQRDHFVSNLAIPPL